MQAAELGIRRILVPKLSPAFSALGLLLTDHVVDEMRSYVAPRRQVDLERVNRLFAEMEESARAALAGGGRKRAAPHRAHGRALLPGTDVRHGRAARGARGPVTARALAATVERFHRLHEELHTYASRDQEPILRGLRLKAVARRAQARAAARVARGAAQRARSARARRSSAAASSRRRSTTARGSAPGQAILGPAIIEEPFTTIVVYRASARRSTRTATT